jgi:hypothetical protein
MGDAQLCYSCPVRRIAIVVVIVACRDDRAPARAPTEPDALAEYLRAVAELDEPARGREIAALRLDEPAWRRIVVDPYRALWSEYTRAFPADSAAIAVQLRTRGVISARRHFAGDPRLTRAEARLRWVLPVMYPSVVAELDGAPIDAVFVHDGGRWRALSGLDAVVRTRVRELDAACGERFERAGPSGRCTELAWAIAEAALRGDSRGFAHACELAAPHCANAPP